MEAIAHNAWAGIPLGLTPSIIDSVFHHIECTACFLGKRKRDRSSSSRDHQAASMTVAAGEEDDDDEEDEQSSSSDDAST